MYIVFHTKHFYGLVLFFYRCERLASLTRFYRYNRIFFIFFFI